jgi:hypothetical protein
MAHESCPTMAAAPVYWDGAVPFLVEVGDDVIVLVTIMPVVEYVVTLYDADMEDVRDANGVSVQWSMKHWEHQENLRPTTIAVIVLVPVEVAVLVVVVVLVIALSKLAA